MTELSNQDRFEQTLTPEIYTRAWRYACRLKVTRQDAEDLLQDSLASAFRSFDQLRHPERFAAWLMSIMRNHHLSGLNKVQQQDLESCWQRLASTSTFEHLLAGYIADAMAILPVEQQEVLHLFYLEGLSLDETSWVLGTTRHAVGQKLYRARQALRKECQEARIHGVEPQRCKQ